MHVEAFLDALSDLRPLNCVITDVRMPGMSGIDLLRHLKSRKFEVPVIVITDLERLFLQSRQ
jgi:two-component system response regulator FixJ